MPVIREGKIDSLTEAGMNAFEKEITKFERLAKKITELEERLEKDKNCLLYTSPSPRDRQKTRMPSSA